MRRIAALVGALLVVGVAGSASAARPWQEVQFDATVSAAGSSVLGNDGNAQYSGSEVLARLMDHAVDSGDSDYLFFAPQQKRKISFQHPDIAGGQQLLCSAGGHLQFRSYSSPSTTWEEIQSQGSAFGTALIRCIPDNGNSSQFLVRYPGSSTDGGAGECVSFAKTGENTYRISAEEYVPATAGIGIGPFSETVGAAGCPATVSEVRWEKGRFVTQERADQVSAPFTLELTTQS